MPQKKYIVRLTPEEREVCRETIRKLSGSSDLPLSGWLGTRDAPESDLCPARDQRNRKTRPISRILESRSSVRNPLLGMHFAVTQQCLKPASPGPFIDHNT